MAEYRHEPKESMSKVNPQSQVTRTRADVKANYDKLSPWYDVLAGSAEQKYKDVGLRKLNVKSGEQVLEIGFGTGQCLLSLAQAAGHAGKVYGVDLSEGMAGVARTKVTKAGLSQRVDLICADAIALPYPENSMNAIFMSFTLDLFETSEIPIVLGECHRVLAPAGRICVVAMGIREESNLMVSLYDWAHARFPNMIDCRPIHSHRALAEAGFSVEDTSEMSMYALPVDIVLASVNKP